MVKEYVKTIGLMSGRSPGKTCMKMLHNNKYDDFEPFKTPFLDRGGGCGASMRCACIGLAYGLDEIETLIEVSIEASRVTHHNPIGYLGGVMAALFTRLALEQIDPNI